MFTAYPFYFDECNHRVLHSSNVRKERGREKRSDVLEELFYDHYRPALLYPLSLCRNLANAEDIVSQAFETALMAPEGSIQSGC